MTSRDRCAFAVYAKGERFEAYKAHAIKGLEKHAPGVDIVEIDMAQADKFLCSLPQEHRPAFARLTIPLIEQFSKYDKVAWVDVDVDVVSDRFAEVFDADTGASGVAAAADRWQIWSKEYIKGRFPEWDKPVYFNSGVLLMDLRKIDRDKWVEGMNEGIKEHLRENFLTRDQDLINAYYDVTELDRRFNGQQSHGRLPKDAYLLHYVSGDGHDELDRIVSRDDVSPVDAVFIIGTGSIHGNEELRYALRNLEAHCKFVRDVYICGECPSWVDKSVVRHLPWPDRFKHAKDANIVDKLRHACESRTIAKRILFCSDDQFQTRECFWDDFFPRRCRRYDPGDKWFRKGKNAWHDRLCKTLERERLRREAAGIDTKGIFYYQPHIWMPIDRDKFIEYAKWSDYEHRDDTIIASGYYNYIGSPGVDNYDHVFLKGVVAGMPKVTHVAYDDSRYRLAMSILERMFPNKSKFEIDAPVRRKMRSAKRGSRPPIDRRTPEVAAKDVRFVALRRR